LIAVIMEPEMAAAAAGVASAECEEKTAAGLGGAGDEGVAAPRTQTDLLEEPAGSLRAPAAEPAEELLPTVADEQQADRRPRY
jgi:hypothetical protein